MPTKKYQQITQQIEKLQQEAEQIRSAAIKGVIEQINALMTEHGITVADLRGSGTGRKRGRPAKKKNAGKAAKSSAGKRRGRPAGAKSKARAKVKPKYRSPDDRKLTWTGRGRTPLWVKGLLDKGKKLEELLIK
jgi:DNA-binding protein H-NS